MTDEVTVAIPHIPTRHMELGRAIKSVLNQDHPVSAVAIATDLDHRGAWTTRNRAASMVETEWTVFLDDDDELLPHYVSRLLGIAHAANVDLVSGWFEVIGGSDPFEPLGFRGRQYNPSQPHVVPITYLVRTALLREATIKCGGFRPDDIGAWDNQDQPLLDTMHALSGGRFMMIEDIVWRWHHHGRNTSGMPARW